MACVGLRRISQVQVIQSTQKAMCSIFKKVHSWNDTTSFKWMDKYIVVKLSKVFFLE